MSKGPNSKNPASATGSEGAAASSAAPWQPFGAAWGTSFDVLSAWGEAWQSMLQQRGVPATEAMLKTFNPAAWPGSITPLIDELEDVFALPHFADLPRLDGSALPSPGPLVELMMVAQPCHGSVWWRVGWAQACQRFQAEVAERRARGDTLDSAGAAMDLWNNVLDRTLMEFNRSADFAKVQQRFLQAAMRQRRAVRTTFERAAKGVDLPTRTEMTDVYQRLHDLLREVHGLRREVRALREAPAAPAAKTAAPKTQDDRAGKTAPDAAQKPAPARKKQPG
jgi:hypothetical protein